MDFVFSIIIYSFQRGFDKESGCSPHPIEQLHCRSSFQIPLYMLVSHAVYLHKRARWFTLDHCFVMYPKLVNKQLHFYYIIL